MEVVVLLHDCCTVCRMAATVFVQPLDLVKNRMQLSGKKYVGFFFWELSLI